MWLFYLYGMSLQILNLPTFTFSSGVTLHQVPVAFQTFGTLNAAKDNALLVCHALTGTANAADWWSGLVGENKVLNTLQYFVVCVNVLGSPYGTASPITLNPQTQKPYQADFPQSSIRDNVKVQQAVLQHLGITQLVAVLGGSMGGMQALEWAFEPNWTPKIGAFGCGGRHSAWAIGWGESQRNAIWADAHFNGGFYTQAPATGLAAARQIAMLTYRTPQLYQNRFNRSQRNDKFEIENYLNYQGQKLVQRFDANCYIHLTYTMDTHDVAHNRGNYYDVLKSIAQDVLIVGIDSDVLYPLWEQQELAAHIPNATFKVLHSDFGHDAFLVEFEKMSTFIQEWL
jgi:homoserine O-acetyltransferase/O-succinyltransferase